MLINTHETDFAHVEFISYNGEYPNLCRGTLHLKIDGEDVFFGYRFSSALSKDEQKILDSTELYSPFWNSGGRCGFHNQYSDPYTIKEEWQIDVQDIPEKYRKYAPEIDELFNDNVPYGCCGGCL